MNKRSNIQAALTDIAQLFSEEKYTDALQLSQKFQKVLKDQPSVPSSDRALSTKN